MRPLVYVFSVLLVAALAAACSQNVTMDAITFQPVVEKAPVKVAVVYDKSLANQQCTVSSGYIASEWTIAIGPTSVGAFSSVFSSLFEDVVVVSAAERTLPEEGRYVITVYLDDYSGCDVSWPIFGQGIGVSFSADVARGSEVVLTEWTGRGYAVGPQSAHDMDSFSWDEATQGIEAIYIRRTTQAAIRSAIGDFVREFENDERVRAWKAAAISDALEDR